MPRRRIRKPPAPDNRSKSTRAVQIPTGDQPFTIDQFCAWYNISRQTYQNYRADGIGPEETRSPSGRIIRITRAAAEAFAKARAVAAKKKK